MDWDWGDFFAWLNKWQTLISGVMALIAALITMVFLRKQIRQADAQERARQRRRHAAARATLPLALSQICSYAETAAREMSALQRALATPGAVADPSFSRPEPPAELVASLERMIEATDDPDVTRVLSDLIIEMQVLAANLESLAGAEGRQRSSRLNIDAYFVRAARIHALASGLFPYARGEQDFVEKIGADDMIRSLKLVGLNEMDHARAFELAHGSSNRTGSSRGTSALPKR